MQKGKELRAMKIMKLYRNFLLPTGLLAGTIIGAGVFALPYVFVRSGLAVGFFYLALAAVAYTVIHLLYADVIVRTAGEHRFVGYARMYLGRFGGDIASVMVHGGNLFALTIYLVLSVSFANLLFAGGADILKLLIFWALGSAAIFFNLREIALSELVVTAFMAGIIGFIFFLGFDRIGALPAALFAAGGTYALAPLAPILFALSGRVAVPAVVKYFKINHDSHDYRAIKKSVTIGTLFPVLVYAGFILGVIGLSSGGVSEDAVSGLISVVPPGLLTVVGVLGLLSLWSSYLMIGLDTNASLQYDFSLSKTLRLGIVVLAPLLLYFAGFQNFLTLVSFAGGVFLGLEGVFIVAMWLAARRRRTGSLFPKATPLAAYAVFAVFATALLYEIFSRLV